MPYTESGRVVAVNTVYLGDVLAEDAPVGSDGLVVYDASPFPADGGFLRLGDTVLEFEDVNDEDGLIILTVPLTFDAFEGDEVTFWDTSTGKPFQEVVAQVAAEGSDFSDDAIEATVPIGLVPLLPEGIRGTDAEAETVTLERRGEEVYIATVEGLAPEFDGSYLRVGTVDAEALVSDLVLSSRIIAGGSTTGARIEMNPSGLEAFDVNGAKTFDVDGATGAVAMVGSLATGTDAARVEISQTEGLGAVDFFSGNTYETGRARLSVESLEGTSAMTSTLGLVLQGPKAGNYPQPKIEMYSQNQEAEYSTGGEVAVRGAESLQIFGLDGYDLTESAHYFRINPGTNPITGAPLAGTWIKAAQKGTQDASAITIESSRVTFRVGNNGADLWVDSGSDGWPRIGSATGGPTIKIVSNQAQIRNTTDTGYADFAALEVKAIGGLNLGGGGVGRVLKGLDFGTYVGTTGSTGYINIPHGLGEVPASVSVMSASHYGQSHNVTWDNGGSTANNIRVLVKNHDGAAVASTTVTLTWQAFA